MSSVPLLKTTGCICGLEARDWRAGATSAKVERELYAFMREDMAEGEREREWLRKACPREWEVMVEKSMYWSGMGVSQWVLGGR